MSKTSFFKEDIETEEFLLDLDTDDITLNNGQPLARYHQESITSSIEKCEMPMIYSKYHEQYVKDVVESVLDNLGLETVLPLKEIINFLPNPVRFTSLGSEVDRNQEQELSDIWNLVDDLKFRANELHVEYQSKITSEKLNSVKLSMPAIKSSLDEEYIDEPTFLRSNNQIQSHNIQSKDTKQNKSVYVSDDAFTAGFSFAEQSQHNIILSSDGITSLNESQDSNVLKQERENNLTGLTSCEYNCSKDTYLNSIPNVNNKLKTSIDSELIFEENIIKEPVSEYTNKSDNKNQSFQILSEHTKENKVYVESSYENLILNKNEFQVEFKQDDDLDCLGWSIPNRNYDNIKDINSELRLITWENNYDKGISILNSLNPQAFNSILEEEEEIEIPNPYKSTEVDLERRCTDELNNEFSISTKQVKATLEDDLFRHMIGIENEHEIAQQKLEGWAALHLLLESALAQGSTSEIYNQALSIAKKFDLNCKPEEELSPEVAEATELLFPQLDEENISTEQSRTHPDPCYTIKQFLDLVEKVDSYEQNRIKSLIEERRRIFLKT